MVRAPVRIPAEGRQQVALGVAGGRGRGRRSRPPRGRAPRGRRTTRPPRAPASGRAGCRHRSRPRGPSRGPGGRRRAGGRTRPSAPRRRTGARCRSAAASRRPRRIASRGGGQRGPDRVVAEQVAVEAVAHLLDRAPLHQRARSTGPRRRRGWPGPGRSSPGTASGRSHWSARDRVDPVRPALDRAVVERVRGPSERSALQGRRGPRGPTSRGPALPLPHGGVGVLGRVERLVPAQPHQAGQQGEPQRAARRTPARPAPA